MGENKDNLEDNLKPIGLLSSLAMGYFEFFFQSYCLEFKKLVVQINWIVTEFQKFEMNM